MPAISAAQAPDAAAQAAQQAAIEAQTRRVESALARLQAEQQSIYQQFQMIQGLRDGLMVELRQSTQVFTPEPTPPSYNDMIARRTEREDRLEAYASEMDRLYARFREIEDMKRPLLEELSALALER